MGNNTSIVTTTAEDATRQTVVAYQTGVLAHVEGDWQQHNVVRILGGGTASLPFKDQAANTVSPDTCRILVTETTGDTDIGVTFPVTAVEVVTQSGSAPVILVQPADQEVVNGATALFNVVAASAVLPITYQWSKDFAAIPGATDDDLVLPGVTAVSAGTYTVTVFNAFGSTTSNLAELTVT